MAGASTWCTVGGLCRLGPAGYKPYSALVGMPASVWRIIFNHMLAPYKNELRVLCCPLHMGPMHSSKSCAADERSHVDDEVEMVSRVKSIMRLRSLHSRLNDYCTTILREHVTWNFCISLMRHPNQFSRHPMVRFLGTEAYAVYFQYQLRRPHQISQLMQLVKSARLTVELPSAESDTVAGRLKEFEGVDNLLSITSMLPWPYTGIKVDIHFRYGTWASNKEEPRPEWPCWQLEYLSEYLKALQHVPDRVILDLHFEYIGDHSIYGAKYKHKVVPAPLPHHSAQWKLARELMTPHRSRHFQSPKPTLLGKYMVFREWICSQFVFIHVERDDDGNILDGCNRWLVTRDFHLAEQLLAMAVERVWRAHASGDADEFQKAKMRVLYARDEWSSRMTQLLMDI